MNIYPNAEVPLSEADRSEIEGLFIALMRDRDEAGREGSQSSGGASAAAENLELPYFDPPNNLGDLRSQWGL